MPQNIKAWFGKFALGRFCLRMLDQKLIRFFLVAGLNTAFGFLVYALLVFIGLPYWLAALLGQIIGIIFNFRTYGALVFKNNNLKLLPRFFLVYTITYFCNVGGMWLLKNTFGMSDYYTAAVMLVPIGILGFVLSKFLVFEGFGKKNCGNRAVSADAGEGKALEKTQQQKQ